MKFRVRAQVTVSIFKEIEATSEEDALNLARDLCLPGLCYQCSEAGRDDNDVWQLGGELDGAATNIAIE